MDNTFNTVMPQKERFCSAGWITTSGTWEKFIAVLKAAERPKDTSVPRIKDFFIGCRDDEDKWADGLVPASSFMGYTFEEAQRRFEREFGGRSRSNAA